MVKFKCMAPGCPDCSSSWSWDWSFPVAINTLGQVRRGVCPLQPTWVTRRKEIRKTEDESWTLSRLLCVCWNIQKGVGRRAQLTETDLSQHNHPLISPLTHELPQKYPGTAGLLTIMLPCEATTLEMLLTHARARLAGQEARPWLSSCLCSTPWWHEIAAISPCLRFCKCGSWGGHLGWLASLGSLRGMTQLARASRTA